MDLSLSDITSLCLVSRALNDKLCDNEDFWRRKFENDYGEDPDSYKSNTYKHLYLSTSQLKNKFDIIINDRASTDATIPIKILERDFKADMKLLDLRQSAILLDNLYMQRLIEDNIRVLKD